MSPSRFGLSDSDFKFILDSFSSYPAIDGLIVFGSRAMGNYKKGSDIDLAVKSKDTEVDKLISRIKDKLENESPMPYFFDIVHYESLDNANLQKNIAECGVEIFKRSR
jgi:predicted nucleotidyltransferase